MNPLLNSKAADQDESHWLTVSDLMAGLMMVFLFIAIALMQNAFEKQKAVQDVAQAYTANQNALYQALHAEFPDDELLRWDATIDPETLTFTVLSPDIMFGEGDAGLSPRYKALLDDFFPRYMAVLTQFLNSITEVRIEGHTSSGWNRSTSDADAYFKNMKLSQDRTRTVLAYVYRLPAVRDQRDWTRSNITAVGFSSSKPVLKDGLQEEDEVRSRRVAFRVITNADKKIGEILGLEP